MQSVCQVTNKKAPWRGCIYALFNQDKVLGAYFWMNAGVALSLFL